MECFSAGVAAKGGEKWLIEVPSQPHIPERPHQVFIIEGNSMIPEGSETIKDPLCIKEEPSMIPEVSETMKDPLSIKEEPDTVKLEMADNQEQSNEKAVSIAFPKYEFDIIKNDIAECCSSGPQLIGKVHSLDAEGSEQRSLQFGAEESDVSENATPYAKEKHVSDLHSQAINHNRSGVSSARRTSSSDSYKRNNFASTSRNHIGKQSHECDQSGKSVILKLSLGKHLNIHKKPLFLCNERGKSFRKRSVMKTNLAVHSNDYLYGCDHCRKYFKLKDSLKRHLLIHSDGKQFTCKGNMKVHSRIHVNKEPFLCEACGKQFRTNSKLTSHSVVHTDERPYRCDACGKSLKRKCDLLRHSKIHTNENLFRCDRCGKQFRTKCNIRVHSRIHKGQFPYWCDECGKRFRLRNNIIIHSKIHTGHNLLRCSGCDKIFEQNADV